MAEVNLAIFMRLPNRQIKITVNISSYTVYCAAQKLKHVNKYHHFRALGGPFLPYVYYCLVVTMHQDLLMWPLVTPSVYG